MKKRKKALSVLLAAVLMCTAAIPVFAADTTEIRYMQEASFTATIPAFVRAAEPGQQDVDAYTVAATDVVIPDNAELTATVEYSGVVRDKSGAEIPYTLYTADGAVTSGDTILQKAAGDPSDTAEVLFGASIDEKARYAGAYTDTATFTFSVDEKVYTAEEIEADEHLYEIGYTGSSVIAAFNDDYSDVVIFANGSNSRGATSNFSGRVSPLTQHADTLSNVTIDDNVTSLGNSLFMNCANIQEVLIPQSVNYICCSETFPTFYGCSSLTAINVDANNKYYSSENGVLFNKNKTELLHYPHGKADLSYVVPEGVEVIGERAFNDQKIVQSVTLSSSVETIDDWAFADCNALTAITFGKSIESVGYGSFYNCTKLKLVDFPIGFEKIGQNAFENCFALEEVKIPETVTSISSTAFRSCTSLTKISLPDGVSLGGSVFMGASIDTLTCLGNVEYMKFTSSIISGSKTLSEVIFENGTTSIPSSAFKDCTNLSKVTIPASVNNIADDAFENCSSLKAIYGSAGSYAETWAAENGYTFIAQ